MKILILQVWDGVHDSEFPTSAKVVLAILLVYFENQGLKGRQDWGQRTKKGPQREPPRVPKPVP